MKPYTFTLSTKALVLIAHGALLAGVLPVLFIGTEYKPLFGIMLWVYFGLGAAAMYVWKRLGGKIKITM